MTNPFEEVKNMATPNNGLTATPLVCPDGMRWKPELIVQWVHLQDGTGPSHYRRHDADDEMFSFWHDVGALVGNNAYSNVVAYKDDQHMNFDKSYRPISDMYLRWDENPLTKKYTDQKESDIIALLDSFQYETNYDGYNGGWKVLVQAATTREGNIFGWHQPYTEGVNPDNIVRIVTMHTATRGKMRGETCPGDSYYWDNCPLMYSNYGWTDKFAPGGITNLPSIDDGAAQMDPEVLVSILVTKAGDTDHDVDRAARWWQRVTCKLNERKLTNVQLAVADPTNFFEGARKQIIRKGCIPWGTTEPVEAKIEAPTESIVTAEDDIVQQDGLKAPILSLDCPSGYKRKDNFLLQWLHVQDGSSNSNYHRHSINDAVRNFWLGAGSILQNRAFSSLSAYTDSKNEVETDDEFWVKRTGFVDYASDKNNVLDQLDSFSFDRSFDGYTGGWKAVVLASTTDENNQFGWNTDQTKATSSDDMMRIVTLHTHAPGKSLLDKGKNLKDYCPHDTDWKDCIDVQQKGKWEDKYSTKGKYNLPGFDDGVAQMDKNIEYVFLVSHTKDTHEFYSDAETKWNDVACYMKAHGFSVRVLEDSPRMFDDLYEEFVRKSCYPL